MTGCATYKGEYGDFVCKFYDTKNTVDINGLSEEGKKKKILVIPEEINGYKVDFIGKKVLTGTAIPDFNSQRLEVIYFTKYLHGVFSCNVIPNLKKIYLIEHNMLVNIEYDVTMKNHPKIFMSNFFMSNYKGIEELSAANVSYFYNYEGAPSDGYYWLDDLEDGEKIAYIPENPTREGYLFGGWFKNEDCTEVWDFETDTITKPADEYYENILYAKWNKKNF